MRAKNPEKYKQRCAEMESRALGYVPKEKIKITLKGNECHCTKDNLCPIAATCAANIWEEIHAEQSRQVNVEVV